MARSFSVLLIVPLTDKHKAPASEAAFRLLCNSLIWQ